MTKKPDFDSFINVLLKRGTTDHVPSWELFVDHEIISSILDTKVIPPNEGGDKKAYLRDILAFQLKMGYDYLPVFLEPKLPRDNLMFLNDTAMLSKGKRIWVDEHNGVVSSFDDYERYPWPKPTDMDYSLVEIASKIVPDGMKVMVWTSGVLEYVQWLMGYEALAFAQIENPELVNMMFNQIGGILSDVFKTAADMPNVGLHAMGDDMGFKQSTLFSPDFLRQYVFPWQKACVDSGHRKNIPFILHSCGNLEAVMDDIIDNVGVDAKHSFEDVIIPIEQAREIYGHRVTLVGGVDIDFICRSQEDEIRNRVRKLLEMSTRQGGYLIGSGNSIANYIPVKNYIAMMDEVRDFTFF